MSITQKLDSFWVGLLAGIVFPAIVYIFYWLIFQHQLTFPVRFTRYLINGYLLGNVIKICALGNLLIFYTGLRKKMDGFCKGVILSILLYIGLIAYVNYYVEPDIF